MTAEILSVGTELLLGDIVNTNAAFLSRKLAGLGINCYFQTTVGDNAGRLREALETAFARAEIVICSGGLGPTEDDLTKETCAEYFGLPLDTDEQALADIKAFFGRRGLPMTANNEKQALIPRGAAVLRNGNGTAPGCAIERDGRTLIILPGPPDELEPMFESAAVPLLKKYGGGTLVSRTLRICGIGESAAEELIKPWLAGGNPTVAPYAKLMEVHLRVTGRADTEEAAAALIEPVAAELRAIFGDKIYSERDKSLAETVAGLLVERGLTIACAESCTAGLLCAALGDCPGVSAALKEGVVAYDNEAKVTRLGVSRDTLRDFGAVSAECAAEMAEGITRNLGTDIGVSITGIAGPASDGTGKPAGLVYVGLRAFGRTDVREFHFTGTREKIRKSSVVKALDMVRLAALKG
ncbi:MAG: competence/damage-inducible protein A [Clostridiales bacterium]|jgi:nicotinamide-nucleotide amidase|nr:competence/damage-inducible protein A [Clostridiales bacterium]